MGAAIEQIKALNWYYFLIVVRSFEDQQRILNASPLYMDGRIVSVVHWETDLNSKPIKPSDSPIWIDLMAMDPLLEIHANFLLKQVGRLVFASTSTSLNQYAHICGCVLVDMDRPIVGQVQIDVVEEGTIFLDVTYKSLPFDCKYCNEWGHPKKLCVNRRRYLECI